jgi:hypothetical protein
MSFYERHKNNCPQILCVIIFGKLSLSGKLVTGKALGKMWNLLTITPGMITLAAVYVRTQQIIPKNSNTNTFNQAQYVVSPDTQFGKIGDKTKTNYEQNFRGFKQFIVQMTGTPVMKATIAFFNKEVFVGVRGGVKDQTEVEAAEDFSEQLATAMEKFCFGDDEDDSGGTNIDTPQVPVQRHSGAALPATSDHRSQQNSSAGPSMPCVATQPTGEVEMDGLDQMEDDTVDSSVPVTRTTRGTRGRGNKKGKAKA